MTPGTSVQLTIQKNRTSAFATLQDLQNVIVARLFVAYLMHHLHQNQGDFMVRVKLWDSFVWSGPVHFTTNIGLFCEAWSSASQHMGKHSGIRILAKGDRLNPDLSFEEYRELFGDHPQSVNLHVVLELHGGGSKAEAAIKTKEDFVARALQVGFDPLETKQFAHQLYQEAGAARMRSLLTIPDEDAFVQQCGLVAKQLRISLPQIHDLEASRTKRVKAALNSKSVGPGQIPANDIRIEPGTFCRHDGTPVDMCMTPHCLDRGVLFIEPADISAFVQEHDQKHEEMMAVAPGTKCPIQDKKCQRFNIPVRLSDNEKVVIAACCHPMGTQAVTVRLSNGDAATVTQTVRSLEVRVLRYQLGGNPRGANSNHVQDVGYHPC